MTEFSPVSKSPTSQFSKPRNEENILKSRRITIPAPFKLSTKKSPTEKKSKAISNNKILKRFSLYGSLSPAFRSQTRIESKNSGVSKEALGNLSERTREIFDLMERSCLKVQVSGFCRSLKLSPRFPLKTESKWFPKVKVKDLREN